MDADICVMHTLYKYQAGCLCVRLTGGLPSCDYCFVLENQKVWGLCAFLSGMFVFDRKPHSFDPKRSECQRVLCPLTQLANLILIYVNQHNV